MRRLHSVLRPQHNKDVDEHKYSKCHQDSWPLLEQTLGGGDEGGGFVQLGDRVAFGG